MRAPPSCLRVFVAALLLATAGATPACDHGGGSGAPDPLDPPGDQPAFPLLDGHIQQADIAAGRFGFEALFVMGDELFEAQFNALDGVGALALPDGTPFPQRFGRMPPGGGRFTGPNGDSCQSCHNTPFGTSAGGAASNVIQDPARDGVGPFNIRNTTSLFGAGALQRLAEEITEHLHALRDQAEQALGTATGTIAMTALVVRGIDYGTLTLVRGADGSALVDATTLDGLDPDLVVRPYGWKGNATTLRDFVRGASRNEMGMEPEEIVFKLNAPDRFGEPFPAAPGLDPDKDGIGLGAGEPELSTGDITANTLYIAAQEVPQELERLVRDGFVPPPSGERGRLIDRGGPLFTAIGCAVCHVPELALLDPVFEEPTLRGRGFYLDAELRAADAAYDPLRPARFHLVQQGDFPRLTPRDQGGARVRLYGDLKRHDMGAALADAQPTPVTGADGRQVRVTIADPTTPGAALEVALVVPEGTFLTPELWGVGSTGPWLHDGRAGSLEEAILLHGGDAAPARNAFAALADDDRLAVVELLRSLVLFESPFAGDG